MTGKKVHFAERLASFLIGVRDHPDTAADIGLYWISPEIFAAQSQTLAANMHLKQNTICSNFRSHGFATFAAKKFQSCIAHLPEPLKWKLHWHPAVTRQSIELNIARVKWVRKQRNPERKEGEALPKPTDDHPIGSVAAELKPFEHPSTSERASDLGDSAGEDWLGEFCQELSDPGFEPSDIPPWWFDQEVFDNEMKAKQFT
jgi:hypothetical protein